MLSLLRLQSDLMRHRPYDPDAGPSSKRSRTWWMFVLEYHEQCRSTVVGGSSGSGQSAPQPSANRMAIDRGKVHEQPGHKPCFALLHCLWMSGST